MTQLPSRPTSQSTPNHRDADFLDTNSLTNGHPNEHASSKQELELVRDPNSKASELESPLPLQTQPRLTSVRGNKPNPLQWFYKLPIRRKQFFALLTSEAISLVGLAGVGALLIVAGGRSQLINQAKSELVVTEVNYNIKVNQMGFGFRGQSDNAAIIDAAKIHAEGKPLTPDLKSQIQKILKNEINARTIEYATLVGKDLKIIVNANADRTGESFDPNNLVSQVFQNPQQIKTTEIVSWTELAQESPPLPTGFNNQDALIRYTVTPVKNPDTGQAIAALVSGDIVNNKLPIVQQTVDAFAGGYSAVYLRQPTGEFAVATAIEQAKANVTLPDTSLLNAAVNAPGKKVTQRIDMGEQTYTVAAKAVTNFAGEPIAILLRGTQETAMNALLRNSLQFQLIVSGLAIGADILLAILLGRAIAKPIKQLQQTAWEFFKGNFQARAEIFATDEVGQLASTFNEMAEKIETNTQQTQAAYQAAERLAEEQRHSKEKLQQRALELLMEVDPISKGNLTIRAKVTDDEIGTIADSYNATVANLRKIVTQVQAAANQVAETTSSNEAFVQALSGEALQQMQEMSAALDRVQEMVDSVQLVASSAQQAEAAVRQAQETVREGDTAMNRTVDGILAIRETVAETAKIVKRLGESSQKISIVVNLISSFAEQTHMLALNASIEAAQSGKEGRGFTVISQEVRKLAKQSAQATTEIENLVAQVQEQTNDVIVAIEASTEQVVTETRLVNETRASLNKIMTASAEINQLVEAIAQETVVQTQASEAVTQTMMNVVAIAETTSTQAKQISSSFEELLQVAQALQTEVGQFQVSE